MAGGWGLAGLIEEQPGRVSYRRSLEILMAADGALVLGVDDAGYIPSKLFSYALSGKPLLACLHVRSPGFEWFARLPALGHALKFGADDGTSLEQTMAIMLSYLREADEKKSFDRTSLLQTRLSTSMADQHIQVFEACLK
jgi:hypothetical protein